MKTAIILILSSLSCVAQNVAVLTYQNDASGVPNGWPKQVQPIGASTNLPAGYEPPWIVMTQAQLNAQMESLAAAKELWNQVVATREERKQRVGLVLQERIESGHWEPNRLRLHALESELFGKLMQAFRLNSELLLLVTKAVAGTAATNNLTAPERARVVALRPQLSFEPAQDLTQSDRDRVIAITAELQKVEDLWQAARALRANIETNSAYVDPAAGWPNAVIGE